ncbi:MAG: hypothetical protein LHV68_00610 [Elusimicrobia bacterium]|nr:hypothetical protein [Candidatus Liberimonas magnetica]
MYAPTEPSPIDTTSGSGFIFRNSPPVLPAETAKATLYVTNENKINIENLITICSGIPTIKSVYRSKFSTLFDLIFRVFLFIF